MIIYSSLLKIRYNYIFNHLIFRNCLDSDFNPVAILTNDHIRFFCLKPAYFHTNTQLTYTRLILGLQERRVLAQDIFCRSWHTLTEVGFVTN